MTFWAYLLRCADGSYYAGHTDNLEQRIGQHNSGQIEGYTQRRRPVTLVWSQDFPSRIEALEAERRIKGWTRVKKEALIAGDWQALHEAAIPPSERALRLRSGRTDEGNEPTSPSAFVLSEVEAPVPTRRPSSSSSAPSSPKTSARPPAPCSISG
jgi:tRNA/rRNA methyltransferase